MAFTEGGRVNLNFEYDPRLGRPVRKMKSTDLFQISTGTVILAAASVLGVGVVGTLTEMYATAYRFAATTSTILYIVDVTVGTSTVMSHAIGNTGAGDTNVAQGYTDINAPFFRAGEFATVTIASRAASTTGGTLSVWLSGVVHPKLVSVETK